MSHFIKSDKMQKLAYTCGWLLFAVYFLFLQYRLFFYAYGTYYRSASREIRYNMVPLRTIINFIRYSNRFGIGEVVTNLLGNIAAFMPFGFFIPVLIKRMRYPGYISIASFLASLLVETAQLLTRLGTFDVDDLLLNTAGGMVGYAVATLVISIIRQLTSG